MQFINQHSFTLAAVAAVLILAALLLHDGVRVNDLIALGALMAGLAFAYVLFRPSANSSVDSRSIEALTHTGKPVLLEFQSPY